MIAFVFTLVKKEKMIKTHTNPELLNDLRKLCLGVKEIKIYFSTNEENDFDYRDGEGDFYDANRNYIDYDKLIDAYDAVNNVEDGIGRELWDYLGNLLDVSGIHLHSIWWQGMFSLDLENGVVSLEDDNNYDIEEIKNELENYFDEDRLERYIKNLPDFYYDKNKEQSKKFAPYGYADNDSLVPIVKFLMCNEM